MTELGGTALAFHNSGCCIVPAAVNGTKAPWPDSPRWKHYETKRPTEDQLHTWFGDDGRYDGLGVVCGPVSGGLEMLELEGRAVTEGHLTGLSQALTDHGYGELWQRVTTGYTEMTPSGGLHILYKVDGDQRGNTKLARRPATDNELAAYKAEQQQTVDAETDPDVRRRRQDALDRITRGEQVPQVLVETRGNGGFVVTAPSGGRTHESGKPWRLVTGGPATIATISDDERDALHAIASLFDTMPAAGPPPAAGQPHHPDDDGLRPGDDYNLRADWAEILQPHGWVHVANFGTARGWRRPGKNRGVSATTGTNDADNLYCFTTSTTFDAEKPYSKFAAFTLLEHGGDYATAAGDLRTRGYGGQRPPDDDVADMVGDVDGNLATVHTLQPDEQEAPHLEVVTERTHEHSDDRNALALIQRFGDVIRYCPDRGLWLVWDGTRWQWQETGGGVVREYAKRVARSLPEETKPEQKYKQRSLAAVGLGGVLAFAQTDSQVVVSINELDTHAWELNTPAGIVDLRSGGVGDPEPGQLHTRSTTVTPDFDADPSVWQQFLTDTFGDDQDLISYLQRLVGYSATGYIGPHILPFAHGSGGNGKGVFLEAITKVLGDYGTTAPNKFLMAQSFAQHETEIARLAGARMVLCSEVDEDDRFDEAKVKQLTGGDSLTARFMRRDHFTFRPTHQLWLIGNHKPAVHSGGRAFWRRLRLIPFVREVPEEKMVDDLQGILARDHGPAILAWIIQGTVDFFNTGLREPDSVKTATAEYERDQDTIARFIDECCRIGGGDNVATKTSKVRDSYEKWCEAEGETPVNPKAFSQALTRRYGVGRDRLSGGSSGGSRSRVYTNIAVLGGDEDDGDPDSEGWFR